MKIYYQTNEEEIEEAITRALCEITGKEVFAIRIIGENKKTLDTIIVFKDKSVLMAEVFIEKIDGQLAARVRGNYI